MWILGEISLVVSDCRCCGFEHAFVLHIIPMSQGLFGWSFDIGCRSQNLAGHYHQCDVILYRYIQNLQKLTLIEKYRDYCQSIINVSNSVANIR